MYSTVQLNYSNCFMLGKNYTIIHKFIINQFKKNMKNHTSRALIFVDPLPP